MEAETVFSDLGVNALDGTRMMDMLGIHMSELNIPQRFFKLHEIIKYIRQFPEDTQRFLVNKAVRNKNVNKLDHMFEYMHILKEKESYETQLRDIEKELSIFDPAIDFHKVAELQLAENSIKESLQNLDSEKAIYER